MSKALVIIKSMGIGDLCILISNIHAISKKIEKKVTVLAHKNTRASEILKNDPHVEEVIELTENEIKGFINIIKIIRSKHSNIEIAIAPGPDEMEEAKKIEAIPITNNDEPLNIMELAGLIKKSSYVIANDTGPAHMAAHLGKNGTVLFGYHTTPKNVSIENEKFKAISSENLDNLTAEQVYLKIQSKLELIN